MQETNVVASTTQAESGDITSAPAGLATSQQDRSTAGAAGVVEQPAADDSPQPAGSDEIRLAALFVQPDGCYAGLPDVDAWPEQRDARRYAGPLPVVAHPPCQLWGAMANVNYARWGGDHNRPGNDGGCFAAAHNA